MEEPTARQLLHPEAGHSPDTARIIALGGAGLVLVGLTVLLFASWDSFGPAARAALSAVPVAGLYLGAVAAAKRDRHIGELLAVAGSAALPFAAGAVALQAGAFSRIGPDAVFTLALAGAGTAAVFAFGLRERAHRFLVIAGVLIAGGALLATVSEGSGAAPLYSLVAAVIGGALCALGTVELYSRPPHSPEYAVTGGALLSFAVFSLPFTLPEIMPTAEAGIVFGSLAAAAFSLVAAVFLRRAYDREASPRIAEAGRLFEVAAPAFLVIGSLIAALSHRNPAYAALALAASGAVLWASFRVAVPAWRAFGWAGTALALVILMTSALKNLAGLWPVMLIAAGFILIGTAVAVSDPTRRRSAGRLFSPVNHSVSLLRLGTYPAPAPPLPAAEASYLAGLPDIAPAKTGGGFGAVLIVGALLTILALMLVGGL